MCAATAPAHTPPPPPPDPQPRLPPSLVTQRLTPPAAPSLHAIRWVEQLTSLLETREAAAAANRRRFSARQATPPSSSASSTPREAAATSPPAVAATTGAATADAPPEASAVALEPLRFKLYKADVSSRLGITLTSSGGRGELTAAAGRTVTVTRLSEDGPGKASGLQLGMQLLQASCLSPHRLPPEPRLCPRPPPTHGTFASGPRVRRSTRRVCGATGRPPSCSGAYQAK